MVTVHGSPRTHDASAASGPRSWKSPRYTPAPSSSVKQLLAQARAQLSSLVANGQLAASNPAADGGEAAAATSSSAAARKAALSFWLMAAATYAFVQAEGGGLLPLIGTLPDMTADTQTYVTLQQLYAAQAAADVAAVQAHVREIAAAEGISADDLVAALDQAVDHVGPDEARSTRHQPTHATS